MLKWELHWIWGWESIEYPASCIGGGGALRYAVTSKNNIIEYKIRSITRRSAQHVAPEERFLTKGIHTNFTFFKICNSWAIQLFLITNLIKTDIFVFVYGGCVTMGDYPARAVCRNVQDGGGAGGSAQPSAILNGNYYVIILARTLPITPLRH